MAVKIGIWAVAVMLIGNMALGLVRVIRGPAPADRMLAALLFGTTGTATLVVLSVALNDYSLREVSLVLALLAAISTIVFVRRGMALTGDSLEDGELVESQQLDAEG